MVGTLEGGRKAAITNKEKYGDDFYKRIGMRGGMNGNTGGFFANPELARRAGAKGGRISRRGEATKTKEMIRANIGTIKKMIENNEPVTKISEATGVPKSTLYKMIRTERILDYQEENQNV